MAVNIKDDGSFEIIYGGQFTGLNVQAPPNLIKDTECTAMSNIMLRNAAIQSRPIFLGGLSGIPLGSSPIAVGYIASDLSGKAHTFIVDNLGKLYVYDEIPNTWDLVGNGDNTNGNTSLANWRVFGGILYYVHGTPSVISWDASTNTLTPNVVSVGGNNVGAFLIDELDQHVLLANTLEGAGPTAHPIRIRWSAIGLPTMFDPSVNINAGFNDFIDVSDFICGMMMLGTVGYLFHQTGITQVSPTGQGSSPFQFDHIWNSPDGSSGFWPHTICQYGQIGAFVSKENVYLVQNYSFTPIGGNARDAIMRDAFLSSSLYQPFSGSVLGSIIPIYRDGYVHLVYQIIMSPVSLNTRIYEYSIESGYWEIYDLPSTTNIGAVCRPFVCQL